jgi:tetratricopeptide (TPR) repeat protein
MLLSALQGTGMRFTDGVKFFLLAGLTLPTAQAANLTDAEFKNLPPFCEARMKRTGQFGHWQSVLGPDFIHTHHYCGGLGMIHRYYRLRTPQDKTAALNEANGDLTYMVQHASPTYSLMPDVYLNRGLVFSLLNQPGAALTDLKKARELNPKLVKAYTLSADIHTKLKQKSEALAAVTEGLRHVPDSKALQRAYQEKGGRLPYPEPIARAPEAAPGKADAAQAVTPETASKPPEGAAANSEVASPSAAPDSAAPKIGSPTNPWCRFCPEPAQ